MFSSVDPEKENWYRPEQVHVNVPISRSHVTARLTALFLYVTILVECTGPLPVAENAIGPVQSMLVFFPGVRGGNGVTAMVLDHNKAHNQKILKLYILQVYRIFNYLYQVSLFLKKQKLSRTCQGRLV